MRPHKPKKPIKVMRIIARLNVGGPAVHCTTLARKLTDHGYETLLVTGRPESEEADYEKLFSVKQEGYRQVRLGNLRKKPSLLGDFKTFLELCLLIRAEKPNIVHTHTAKAGILGRLAAFLNRVPITIHTFHGHVLSGYFSPYLSKAICMLERLLAKKTSTIVTLSPSLRDELSTFFRIAPRDRFQIVPLGRDLREFHQCSRYRGELKKELGLSPETVLITTVGRLVPIKNQALLLRACAAMDPRTPWHLAVVGEGALLESLENLARTLGIDSRVTFLGWRTDLPRIYADTDILALTSLNEGTPLSIIEAFASGCPVISTRVGGVGDLFGPVHPKRVGQPLWERFDPGILVRSEDLPALYDAMQYLVTHPEERQKMSLAGIELSKLFTEEALTQRMATLYDNLVINAHVRSIS